MHLKNINECSTLSCLQVDTPSGKKEKLKLKFDTGYFEVRATNYSNPSFYVQE